MNKKELILKLAEINAIKFGEFKLKTGIMSPIYIDLRVIVSYPEVLKVVAGEMWELIKDQEFDVICGVPYTALPIATVMSVENNKPMVMRRKEVKDYGTKKAIEGEFKAGQKCLIVEDLVTSGSSVFETVDPLKHEGLEVNDVVVLLDREQGGQENVKSKGLKLFSVLKMSELLDVLLEGGKIDQEMNDKVKKFLQENQVKK
ncbi:MAG: orotate phosphoribosyltransferase [Patescibacteria group bacterium]